MSVKGHTFEQPLNERIRMCLRVETLMRRYHYFTGLKGDWSAYSALLGILEITSLLERGDLKQELMKELERQYGALKSLASKDGVDKTKLELVLSKQKNALDRIHQLGGKLGIHLKRIDFLLAIKQRTSIPGGSCDFDLPQLRYWLNQTHAQKLSDLKRWAAPYLELEAVIELILSVIRDSGTPKQVIAEKGFFQQSLDRQHSNQLLRIAIPAGKAYYPEISAGKHRYSVRFLTSKSVDEVPSQVKDDVPFLLSRCSL
ncbi:MAG: cell division protein ZapD [Gammaproteobacteria bacterium]